MTSATSIIDLASLPAPKVVQELSFETIFNELTASFLTYWNARRAEDPTLPEFTTDSLESEPFNALFQAFAYRELLLRGRINEAARANLLAFSDGTDLDHLVAWLDVTRMDGESDERLKERYQLASFGRSAGGPRERYIAVAMGASLDVRDVAVWREGRDPTVNVAVLSTIGNGDATAGLLTTVKSALEQDHVRVVSDNFNVVSAVRKTVDVKVSIRISDQALETVADKVSLNIRNTWVGQDLLGLDLTQAFLVKASLLTGVTDADIVLPANDVEATDNEAIAIGTVTVEIRGRGR
ncbi:baseplate J/gp47 family protein [Roseibium sp.]|uniref:baseplate J/gp47 family protein n=1 Tax=Roseibium sp. TaxID=1936156 RepID=UPI003BAB781F